jgi:hypothetical protein
MYYLLTRGHYSILKFDFIGSVLCVYGQGVIVLSFFNNGTFTLEWEYGYVSCWNEDLKSPIPQPQTLTLCEKWYYQSVLQEYLKSLFQID